METADTEDARFPPLDPDAPGDPFSDVSYPRRSGVADIEPPPVIHTKEFRRWFGDWKNPDADHSVIVDERGRPDVLFHGTLLQPDAEIEGFEPGSFGVSRSIGVHLAFDNRVTDAFTVGREAKDQSKRGPSSFRETTPGEDAMTRIKPGGRVLPVFANVRRPLDLAGGFEPLGYSAEEVWEGRVHDDHLIQHAVTYLALEAEPDLLDVIGLNIDREQIIREVEERIRKIEAGEAYEDEVPPGGMNAIIATNRSASVSTVDEKRERFLEVFYESYPYDGIIYVNTSGQEVMRDEIDPLSLIVFDPANVKSIYAESFEPGDPTLGVRGNPPFIGDRPTAEDLRGSVSLEATDPHRTNPLNDQTQPGAMSDTTDTRENERLEDRLRRQNPGDPREAHSGDGRRGAEPERPNPSAEETGSKDGSEQEVRQNDREDFVELMQAAARLRELFLEKRERIIEKGDEETARQFAEGFGPLFDLLREAADENNADFDTVKEEVGLVETIPEAVPERGPFGFPEESFDDNFYLTAEGETNGHLAIHTSESGEDLAEEDIEDTSITASVSKQVTDALRDGELDIEVEEWTKKGQKWEVAIGEPYGLDLQIKFGDRQLPEADKAYTVIQKGSTSPDAFARFLVDLTKELAPALQEVRASDVQWRVADFASALIQRGTREGTAPEEYVEPRPRQSYILGRPTEQGADPTIVLRSGGVFGVSQDGVLPEQEVELAIRRARQTGIKTAIFVGHGVSAVGQPQQVSRIVIGEKDLKTKPRYDHKPGTLSMVHSRSPQTISMVADHDRREDTERGSPEKIRELLGEVSDLETYRVFPVQQPDGETVDTFYRWHEPTMPENAVNAESEEDLGFSSGETVQASRADIERTFRPEDMGGEEFENVESDVDLTGRDPLVLTPEDRRVANRRAIDIITNKEPAQITDKDREVLLEYTGAGGLGTDTGTGSVRGERTEHYTDYRLIRAMWSAMGNVGQEGNILEPGAGIGNFAGLRPNDQTGHMVMVEQSSTTYDILEVLYPEQQTLHRNLAAVDLRPYQLQGAIGNVPFADTQVHTKNDPVVQGLRAEPKIHDYFILRALHEVEAGGVVMLITSTTTADRQDATLRRAMVRGVDAPGAPMSNHRAAFLGGFRLPSGAFEASASTAVTTDLLAFQKLPDGMPMDDLPAEIFERTNQFAENPATRTDVLRADRTQASQEAVETAQKIESQEERVGELRNRMQHISEKITEIRERRHDLSWQDDEYDELGSRMRELRDERRDVKERGREAKRELDNLKGRLEEMDGQQVSAHLNRFFDENEEFILGDLKFGYKRPALDLFGVEGDLDDAVDRIADFDPNLPVETARPKAIFAEGTGQRLGIDRQHPDGAIVFRDGQFYESQPVGYDPITVEEEFEEKARSAVDILETYEAFTRALAREDEETETVRESLKVKLRNHVRRFGVPGDDPDLMEEVFRFDPRRPTLAALVETNAVGNVQFADVLDFNDWYRNDQKSSIEDDENLEAISQFLRAQGEKLSAESYARFYKGGELSVGEMEDLLEESDSFYFIPQVGPVEVVDLSEAVIDEVLDHVNLEEVDEDLTAIDVVAERAAEAYMEREGSYMPEVFFTSGEIWSRIDLYEEIRERSSDAEVQDRMSSILETLREALPEQKEYWDIAIDPRHYRSWLPIEILQEWIEDETGYDTEIEWIDAPDNPDDRKLILRYRNNGTYVSGFSDDNYSQEDLSRGWHGIPYSNILARYLKGQHFPIKHGGNAYVDPETKEPIPDVTTQEEAKERGIYTQNKRIQSQNETEMRETMKSDFEEWADSASSEMRSRIAEAYNRTYRSRSFPDFDGSTLNLPGFNFPKPIFEHNLAAAEKMVFNQGGGDNHSVGAGKAQPLDATVMTPEGPTKMGEIEVGDMVMGEDGKPTEVTGVFPQGEMDIFEVTFSDGSTTRCTRDHLWLTQTQAERDNASEAAAKGKDWDCAKPEARTTEEIMETMESRHGGPNHTVPVTEPVEFTESMLTVDPYVLGALIGDGMMHSRRIVLSTGDEEIANEVRAATPAGITLNDTEDREGGCPSYTLRTADDNTGSANPIMRETKALGLYGKRSDEKFIPERYLYGSVEQRTALLQGLMDTDGEVDHKGTSVYFTTVSEKLAGQVQTLVQSLGGTAVKNEKVPRYKYDDEVRVGKTSYRLTLRLPPEIDIFRLGRKADARQPKTKYPARRAITDIEKVGHEEAQCIRVDSESSLYLTDDFVVTHNTFASIIAIETLRQRGLVNKPMFVVPSQVVEKWMKEYQELFPDASILVLRGKSEGLEEELFRAQVYDYDAIFITQTGFKALELSPDARRERINDRIEKNAEIAENLREDLESDYPTSMVSGVPDGIEDRINEWADDIEQIQEEAAEEQVDRIFLDELGVDAFIFDEAHAYKNASAPSQLAAELGIVGDVSQRAVDTKTKVDWLFWKQGDDVNSFILTATPLENNPLEVWHMLQLCGPSVLEKFGIESLDAFIDLYVEVQRRIERKVDGSFDSEEVVTGFQNVTELQRVLDERLDIMSYDELINFYTDPEEEGGLGLDADDIPFGRPDAEVHHDVLEPSEIHEVLLEDIRLRADIIRQALRNGVKLTDNYLSLTTDGGAMAEDLRLYQPGFWGYDGPGLKVDTIAEEVAAEYKRTGLPLDDKGDPIYPPEDAPTDLEPTTPTTARANPSVVTDRFGAPIGREPDRDEERENPSGPNLGRSAHRAARTNPTESEEAFIESLEEGDEVPLDPDFAPGTSEGETVEVDSFAPRNQIIFTSSASFKDGPYYSENPAEELPYVESVERYDTNDMEPPLYVRFESDSWLREIKRLLVEQGIPAEDIAIVSGTIIGLEEGPDGEMQDRYVESDDDKNKFKAQVQEKFQRGEINVIIGTNAISEGMNLDRYTTALYHMDVPWKPSNVEQRNGRALRQGNIYGEMDITFKLLERSFDNYRLKLVNKKQSWIDDVLYGDFDLSEGDDDKVRTQDETGGQSQSMDYQEMMVATSESDVIKNFFEAVHDVQQLDPKLDRLESERKTRKRKLRSAKEEIEEWSDQLEVQQSEFNDVLTTDLPESSEFEEGIHYDADLRYNRGKEWRGEVRMMVAGDRSFEFTGGAGLSGANIGSNANVGTKLITARVTDGSPKVEVRYAWSKRSARNRGQKARSSETYLQRNLNGVAADHEDWMDYWRSDVDELIEGEIREQVKENLGEEESLDEGNLPEIPDPLTIEALYSLFSNQNDNRLDDLTYSEVKQMIGIEPGGRFASEECWQRWTPVIERGVAEGLLGYAHTYESLASEMISEIESKRDKARQQRDLMERSISDIEEQIEETEARLEEAKQEVDDLRGEVNDELASRFDGRGGLYQYLNQIREEFGIDTEIPMRVVGVDTGSDTEEDDEPDDDILVDATLDDVTEEGEEAFEIDEGEESGGQDEPESEPPPSSADEPEEVSPGRLEATLEKTDDSATGHYIVDDESDFIAWAGTRMNTSLEVDPAVLFDEDREVPSFDSPALSDRLRSVVVEGRGQIFSHFGSSFAKRLPSPVPYIPSEDDRMKAIVGQGNKGAYADEMVAVADPIGEDAFELWLFGYAQRQMALGRADSVAEVRSRLQNEYGDFEPRGTPSQVMPSEVQNKMKATGLVVPQGATLHATQGVSPRQVPRHALLDAFVALVPQSGASDYSEVQYIYADHWQFVMQALTTGNTDTVSAENVVMGVLPEEERQMERPAVYFSTPTGVQAFVKVAASGDPLINPFDDDSSADNLFKTSLPMTFGERVNPSPNGASTDRRDIFPASPIGQGHVRSNPGQSPTDVASVDTDHALSYLARTEPGTFKVNVGEKQVRANEEEVHHIFTDPNGTLLLIVPDSRVDMVEVPEGTATDAEEMHEEFTHYEADGESMVMDLPDSDPDEAPVVGHAEEIIYESDKVMRPGDEKGEIHTYVHEFDDGQRPVRQWEDVAIVDEVAVDGRGILN